MYDPICYQSVIWSESSFSLIWMPYLTWVYTLIYTELIGWVASAALKHCSDCEFKSKLLQNWKWSIINWNYTCPITSSTGAWLFSEMPDFPSEFSASKAAVQLGVWVGTWETVWVGGTVVEVCKCAIVRYQVGHLAQPERDRYVTVLALWFVVMSKSCIVLYEILEWQKIEKAKIGQSEGDREADRPTDPKRDKSEIRD